MKQTMRCRGCVLFGNNAFLSDIYISNQEPRLATKLKTTNWAPNKEVDISDISVLFPRPPFLSFTHLLDEDVLYGLEQVGLAHRVGAAYPEASPGAVPCCVDLQSRNGTHTFELL